AGAKESGPSGPRSGGLGVGLRMGAGRIFDALGQRPNRKRFTGSRSRRRRRSPNRSAHPVRVRGPALDSAKKAFVLDGNDDAIHDLRVDGRIDQATRLPRLMLGPAPPNHVVFTEISRPFVRRPPARGPAPARTPATSGARGPAGGHLGGLG